MPDSPPALSVTAAARRLGVAPDTLRTWDRRYGLGPTERTAGAHRRYTPNDFARLEVMRRLTLEGYPAQEAARVAQRLMVPVPLAPPPDSSSVETPPPQGGASKELLSARGLVRAALALDGAVLAAIIDQEIERRGVISTWDGMLVPVLRVVGHRAKTRNRNLEVEHLFTETVAASLHVAARRLRTPVNSRPVLAACAPEEVHSLPLLAFAAALAEHQVEVRVFGARLPTEALAAAVRRCGPAAVLVWSQEELTGTCESLTSMLTVRPAPLVLAGGPGWPATLPEPVRRVDSLAEAVASVLRVVGA